MEKSVATYTLLEKITDCIVAVGLLLFWILVYVFNRENVAQVPHTF